MYSLLRLSSLWKWSLHWSPKREMIKINNGFTFNFPFICYLKVQSCKLDNNKCMIASTQTTNTEIFAFMAILVFLCRNVLFKIKKAAETVKEQAAF